MTTTIDQESLLAELRTPTGRWAGEPRPCQVAADPTDPFRLVVDHMRDGHGGEAARLAAEQAVKEFAWHPTTNPYQALVQHMLNGASFDPKKEDESHDCDEGQRRAVRSAIFAELPVLVLEEMTQSRHGYGLAYCLWEESLGELGEGFGWEPILTEWQKKVARVARNERRCPRGRPTPPSWVLRLLARRSFKGMGQ